jgi:simple sugar transport system ATP-binding protein
MSAAEAEISSGLSRASSPLVSGIRKLSKAPPPVLEAVGVSKRFGSLVALDGVDFRLTPGSFHALLGENGAGKSTLVKCIMGFYQADQGRISVGGAAIQVKSPREAQRHGIGMVYQHFTLVENMTVAENLVLARADVPRVIDWKHERRAIEDFMTEMPFQLEPDRLVRKLAAGEKQKLEILKQLYLGSRIVILDEPTSVLTPNEADEVLGMLQGMARECRVSVVMITHKFREVMAYSDEVSVLRRGRLAGTGKTRDLTAEAMAEMMVGAEVPRTALERRELASSDTLLELDRVCANDDLGLAVLCDVSFGVAAGEIVGIAGVSGNGQEELVEVLAGQRPSASGSVQVGGKAYRATREEMREQRVRLLPEAPLRNACVGTMSVAENIGFRSFDVPPCTDFGMFVRMGTVRSRARSAIREYGIKTPSADAPISGLSGGNVQRAVLARELTGEVAVLIAANPCFGLDFAAVSEIRSRIMAARNAGSAVLLVSSDLEEIFALSDRILVMSEGRVVYESRAAEADIADIGRHMGGGHA